MEEPKVLSCSFEHSEGLDKIFGALAKAQGSLEGAKKDTSNPFFKSKYADLESCWAAARKPLADNGLCLTQLPGKSTEGVELTSILGHASGQWISCSLVMKPTKSDPQGVGSCLTYARRYALTAMVGISPEDDDGNASSNPTRKTDKKPDVKIDPTNLLLAFADLGKTQEDMERHLKTDAKNWTEVHGRKLNLWYQDLTKGNTI